MEEDNQQIPPATDEEIAAYLAALRAGRPVRMARYVERDSEGRIVSLTRIPLVDV